jgi:RNA polymerase sigma factor (sigma-70 family)
MIDDAELLRRYSGAGSEAAFTEWVGRHISLVYFTALRRTGDSALAHEIAQSVFSTAARKSAGLVGHPSVTGWLYTTTRHLAEKAVRKEQTRRRYEQDAAMHELTTAEPSREWERLRPIIDDVLDGLDERDREAILIRFFEGRPFADIGVTLRISQDAARMRVDRALEKLRTKLEKRGIQSASAALAVALSTQTGMAVPAGMSTAVSGVAMASTAAKGGAAVLLGFMTTTKTTVVTATLATVLATGFGIAERNRAEGAETRLDAISQEQISLRTRLAQAEKQLSQTETRAAEVERDNDRLLAAVEAARAEQVSSPRSTAKTTAQWPASAGDPSIQYLGAMFPNGIVATIGEKTITVDDVGRELTPLLPKLHQEVPDPNAFRQRRNQLQNDIVKSLVEKNLLIKQFSVPDEGEAPRHVPATVIDQTLADTLKERFSNDPAKFAAYLDSRGMTPDQYRKEVEEDMIYGYMRQQQRKLDKTTQKTTAK